MSCRHKVVTTLGGALLCVFTLGLGPADIALVVNRNNASSMKLAEEYAAARGIPDGRIIVLDLPDAEELPFDQYEMNVAPPIRSFLEAHQLTSTVKCLVTFYGVPFRIRDRVNSGDENRELAELRDRLAAVNRQLKPIVQQEEDLARQLDPDFRPPPLTANETEAQSLARRSAAAENRAGARINTLADIHERHVDATKLIALIGELGGTASLLQHVAATQPAGQLAQTRQELATRVQRAAIEITHLQVRRYDPEARATVRRYVGQIFGPLKLSQVLETQVDYLTPGLTNAALDNELALLWVTDYPRNGPWFNPLNFSIRNFPGSVLMVSRLDGPDPATVSRMIQTSVRVEREGLRGGMALNSFGYPNHLDPGGRNEYKEFDRQIRDLGHLVRAHSDMPVTEEYTRMFDNREVKNTALYCGWYSLRHYIPGMQFSAGAVAYHVASLELVGLHSPDEQGWVRGLLSDGAVAAVGPVAEPYLWTFPPPGEFFPLLMTGKLTLAEVYWKTEPATSWMMCLIGDPLYTPFKTNPALSAQDLPPGLARLVREGSGDSSIQPR